MKKILLTLATFFVAALPTLALGTINQKPVVSDKYSFGPRAPKTEKPAATRASGSIEFSYADGVYSAFSLSQIVGPGCQFYLMFEMSADDIKAYAGNDVTALSVYSPTDYEGNRNSIANATFFITTDLEKGEEYSQKFKMPSDPMALTSVELETPYAITGEEKNLYFGYSFRIPKANDMFYIIVDGIPNDYPGSFMWGYSEDGKFPTEFDYSGAAEIGALSMSLTIEGNNLPENMAKLVQVQLPPYLPISGDGTEMLFAIQNIAVNNLTSVEVKTTVTGMPDIVETYDIQPAISYNETAVLPVVGLKANNPSFVDLSLQITKVNGIEYNGTPFSASVAAYEEGFPKKVVAEDATGTWCGWCPGGIEALEYLKSKYPDTGIAIGAHDDEEMGIESYYGYFNYYVGGFPNITYNRIVYQTPTDTYTEVCSYVDEVMEYFDFPAYAQVSIEGKSSDDGSQAVVKTTSEFTLDTDITHYLSFVIVEDGVGPYLQTNYYASQRVPMNGWEKMGDHVPTIFNDVARYYNCFPGIENSLPASIKANEKNEYSIEMPLDNVTGNEYRVIAMITNGVTGEIVNAAEIALTKDNGAAVDAIEDNSAPVEFFNLNGQKVTNPSNGIFIRRQGSTTTKQILP